MKMNSRERVFTALKREVPDQVPLMELVVDPKVVEKIAPGKGYYDFIEEIGYDVVCFGLSLTVDNLRQYKLDKRKPQVQWLDKEKGIFQGRWGERLVISGEVHTMLIPPTRIESEEDLKTYVPPDPHDPYVFSYLKEIVDRFKGKKAIAWVGGGVFSTPQYLRGGLENLLPDFILNPSLALKLAKISEEYYIEIHRRVIKEGVEIVVLGDDYAGKIGPMISPEHFQRFILPGLKRIVKEIKRAGAYTIIHTDGKIWKLMDMLLETGVDALGPLEPGAGMSLDLVKKKYGRRIAVVGNVDIDLLCRGTPEEVARETKLCLAKASPGGGHIFSSGNSIISSVPPQNLLAMVDTAKKWGKYPLDVPALTSENS